MARYGCCYVSASLILTAAAIAVGIGFFAPYWITGVYWVDNNWNITYITTGGPNGTNIASEYPYRGLWAQCGSECVWFWENGYMLQKNMFTYLKWHLATQVLYFIGATLILATEIYSRVALCCCRSDKHATHALSSIAGIILFSAVLQLCSVAVFGGGAYRDYHVLSNPTKIGQMLESTWDNALNPMPGSAYLGWVFWMAVTGTFLSILSGIFFLFASCNCAHCCRRK